MGKISIDGVECVYDTIIHRHIGPGTTYTCFQFDNLKYSNNVLTYKMRAHVMQIDMNNPYQSLRALVNVEDYFKAFHQVQMVKREKEAGRKPFASSAGFMFRQISNAEGSIKTNELYGTFVVEEELRYSERRPTPSFYESGGVAYIAATQTQGTLSTQTGNYEIGQVNHCRDVADSIACLSLFCNGMPSWAMNNATGVDVLLKVTSKNGRITVGSNTCQVESVLTGCGHKPAAGECIISAKGDKEALLRGLQIGEELTITINYTDEDNKRIDCRNMFKVRSIPAIREGEVILFGKKSTAYIFLGISRDGKTVYLSDLEISSNSNAPTDAFAYMMKELGVYKGNWMDGGPSAEMTVDGEWITVNSIGGGFNGRYIPGAMMIYSVAPDDDVITEVEIAEPSAKGLYVDESYVVELFGYNRYGEMIRKHAEVLPEVKVWCDETIGYVDDGEFNATAEGNGFIYVQVDGQPEIKKIPVTVKNGKHLKIFPESLFTGEGRGCQLKLYLLDKEGQQEVPVTDASWYTNSKYVLSSCNNGFVVPYVDGYAEVIAEYDGLCDTIGVTVENLEELVDCLDLTQMAVIHYDRELLNLQLPSVPHAFSLDVCADANSPVILTYRLGDGKSRTESLETDTAGKGNFLVKLDYENVETYPVTIESLADTGISIEKLLVYYTDIDHIEEVLVDKDDTLYNLLGQKVKHPGKGMHIRNRNEIVFVVQ